MVSPTPLTLLVTMVRLLPRNHESIKLLSRSRVPETTSTLEVLPGLDEQAENLVEGVSPRRVVYRVTEMTVFGRSPGTLSE